MTSEIAFNYDLDSHFPYLWNPETYLLVAPLKRTRVNDFKLTSFEADLSCEDGLTAL